MILGISALGKKKIFIIFAAGKPLSLKIIEKLADYYPNKPLALSIGMFDGVHLGHREIIRRLNHKAGEEGLESALITFWPHPRSVFFPEEKLSLLNTLEEKLDLLEAAGLQNVFLQRFDEEFRNISGEDFVKQLLCSRLRMKHIVIGYDHKFGKNRSGDFQLLQRLSAEYGYEPEKTEAVYYGDEVISSTKIRTALQQGNIGKANAMLGYAYKLSGKVIHGKKIGRTIGYPTANLEIDELKLLPRKGAYIAKATVNGISHKAMMSVMTNPTVGGDSLQTEVHLLDFDGDLYGQTMQVEVLERLHDEIKFESVEKLIVRLDEDKRLTQEFFGAGLSVTR